MRNSAVLHPLPRASFLPVVLITIALWSSTVDAAGPSPAAGSSPGDREYVIFMGLDVGIEISREFHPIISANSKTLQVVSRGQSLQVPYNDRPQELRTQAEPKISRTVLHLDDCRGDRVLSTASDPREDAMSQQILMDSIESHQQQLAHAELSNAMLNAEGVARALSAGQPVPESVQSGVERRVGQALQGFDSAHTPSQGMDRTMDMTASSADAGLFNGFEFVCRISSPVEIEGAYALLRLVVRDPQTPRKTLVTLKFFPVRKITSKPRKFVFAQYGLPQGFSVDKYDVHLYVNGTELATNLSDSRLAVTAAEAHQVLLLRHMADHRAASLPIQAIPELASPELRARVPVGQLDRTVDVDVDENGLVTAVRLAPTETPGADDFIEATLRQARFLPALLNGKPVPSTGSFALSELAP